MTRGTSNVWSLTVFGAVGAAAAVAGSFGLDVLTGAFPVGALAQSALAIAGLWIGRRIALGGAGPGGPAWVGAWLLFFSGPAALELLWDRQLYWESPNWLLFAATAAAMAASTTLGLRVLAAKWVGLKAAALAVASSGLYVLVVFQSARLLPFWIWAVVVLGGWWLMERRRTKG